MTEDEKQAFHEVKEMLVQPGRLAYLLTGQLVKFYTDAACKTGFGFVLKQKQPNREWNPIMVGSRTLMELEKTYMPIESKIKALSWAL